MITQIGGVVYLASLFLASRIRRNSWAGMFRRGVTPLAFLVLYLAATFVLVPLLAVPLGRTPLPIRDSAYLKPFSIWICLLNRHYVRAELKTTLQQVAVAMQKQHPRTVTVYLDANFPFLNGFPLIPHLSHNDGRKADLTFFYTDRKTGKPVNDKPSWFGYGVCEEPLKGEVNTASFCAAQGYWQYSLLKRLFPQPNKAKFNFDKTRTRQFIELLVEEKSIEKLFVEPHLQQRLKLNAYAKIHFHGCRAVRHDDHIHVQLQ
jgi:hypothetical protein